MPSMLTSGVPRSTATRMYATGSDEVRLGSLQNSLASHDLDLRGATRPSDTVIAPPGTFAPVVAIDDASNRTFIGSPVAPDESVTERSRAGDVASLAPTRGCPVCGLPLGALVATCPDGEWGGGATGAAANDVAASTDTSILLCESARSSDTVRHAAYHAMRTLLLNDGVATMAIANSVTTAPIIL